MNAAVLGAGNGVLPPTGAQCCQGLDARGRFQGDVGIPGPPGEDGAKGDKGERGRRGKKVRG